MKARSGRGRKKTIAVFKPLIKWINSRAKLLKNPT
jgi:hypothetical protein